MLQETLQNELEKGEIDSISLPEYFNKSLNSSFKLRPYQEECFRYFLYYWQKFKGKEARPHLLFHMATGSGKTLIMAGLMLYLYEQGYRNFLFFVNSTNIIEKTKDNFFNAYSAKYLFGNNILIGNKRVVVRMVENFQAADSNCINLCLTTIQGLHSALNDPKENSVTYDDFSENKVVLISDEAHHMNVATRRGKAKTPAVVQRELFTQKVETNVADWETTVDLIFRSNANNVLLEFTATVDLHNEVIAKKYKNKLIFDYPLKKFREDGYSKDISLVQSKLPPIDRAIQAMLLSQYKRKLFERIGQNIKPVMMLKSKTIKDNKASFSEFVKAVESLTEDKLARIKANSVGDLQALFSFVKEEDISLENFLAEIKEDFSEEKLLIVDGENKKNVISPQNQKLLNSLEDKNNEIRVVFAVDMLNEGWDVLNLFDIVRMYDTRDGRAGRIGPTTMKEAQLIGRGARYMPFSLDNVNLAIGACNNNAAGDSAPKHFSDNEKGVRKFDNDISNRLRMLETMHYHSPDNTEYIANLKTAMKQTGIYAANAKEVELKLKESFKQTALYKDGCILLNKQEAYIAEDICPGFSEEILSKNYKVHLPSGDVAIGRLDDANDGNQQLQALKENRYSLSDFGTHVIRAALNRSEAFVFSNLKAAYPRLSSVRELIEDHSYLGRIKVTVYSSAGKLENLTQKDKLYVVTEVLRQIQPALSRSQLGLRGSKMFRPYQISAVFRDHIQKFSLDSSSDKEYGTSMRETLNDELRMDLSQAEWHAYNDCYGTSEEKHLIRYIESIYPKLQKQYDDIYLLRNERDFKLYSFETGEAYQPDYVLFLKKKNEHAKTDAIQIFIEPKGKHLLATDKWKEDALKSIKDNADVKWSTQGSDFNVWGMPFYTEDQSHAFADAIEEALNI